MKVIRHAAHTATTSEVDDSTAAELVKAGLATIIDDGRKRPPAKVDEEPAGG